MRLPALLRGAGRWTLLGAALVVLGLAPLACVTPPPLQPPDAALLRSRVRVELSVPPGCEELTLETARGPVRLRSCPGGVLVEGTVRRSYPVHQAGGVRVRWAPGRETLHVGDLEVRRSNDGTLAVSEVLDLETYVAGVVCKELPIYSAEPAALEAQAIAARSYALVTLAERKRQGRRPVSLWASTQDQAYAGKFVPGNAGEERALERVERAVERTRGKVLTLRGAPFAARYHAACGGLTAPLEAAFPRAHDRGIGLRGAACPPCSKGQTTGIEWEAEWTLRELAEIARELRVGKRITKLEPLQLEGLRWIRVRIHGDQRSCDVSAEELREKLGRTRMRSTRLETSGVVRPGDAGLRLRGRGNGHGVGLCQKGAQVLAKQGLGAEAILSRYYPEAAIITLR